VYELHGVQYGPQSDTNLGASLSFGKPGPLHPCFGSTGWRFRSNAKKPGSETRARRRRGDASIRRLGDFGEHLADAVLDRLGGLGRHFLRERRQILGLGSDRLELLAGMCRRELDHV